MKPLPMELDAFLEGYSPDVRTLVLRAREVVLRLLPDATETVWTGWKMVGYGVGPTMNDMIYGIGPQTNRISITFINGAWLDDPNGMLKGRSRTSRHIHITSLEELESLPVRSLMKHALAVFEEMDIAEIGEIEAVDAARQDQSRRVRQRPKLKSVAGGGRGGSRRPVSDAAVRARTGHGWREWFQLLDDAGAATLKHADIVRLLDERFDIEPWWRQMVTVGYERARGLRDVHQAGDGYQVGVSRTIHAPVAALFALWTDESQRRSWLAEPFTIRRATPGKSLRITWHDGSHVDVQFTVKADDRTVVAVDHRKLPNRERVEEMRAFWRARLDGLKASAR